MTEDDEIIQEFTAIRLGMVIERNAAGTIISARIPNPFIVDQLYELEIIDGEQRLAAMHFIAMRRCFLRDVASIATATLYQTPSEPADAPTYPITDTDSLVVLRGMPHEWQRQIVMTACDEHAPLALLYRLSDNVSHRSHVKAAFKALNASVQQLIKIKEQQAESEDKARQADFEIEKLTS